MNILKCVLYAGVPAAMGMEVYTYVGVPVAMGWKSIRRSTCSHGDESLYVGVPVAMGDGSLYVGVPVAMGMKVYT